MDFVCYVLSHSGDSAHVKNTYKYTRRSKLSAAVHMDQNTACLKAQSITLPCIYYSVCMVAVAPCWPLLPRTTRHTHCDTAWPKSLAAKHSRASLTMSCTILMPHAALCSAALLHHAYAYAVKGMLSVWLDTGTTGCGCSALSTSPAQYPSHLVARYHSMVRLRPSSNCTSSFHPRAASLSLPI